jgi:hypothetical protein
MVKSQDQDPRSGSGMNNPDIISETLETIFLGLKYLNSLMLLGSGMEKIRIRNLGEKIWIWDPG